MAAKYDEMGAWLKKEGFEQDVIDIFIDNRIDTSIFLELDQRDYEDLGVRALGDKKRLLLLKKRISDEVS